MHKCWVYYVHTHTHTRAKTIQTTHWFIYFAVLIRLHAIMSKGVWHLSVNQRGDSHLAKAGKASEVYKLITAISTAAPNKPERRSKKEATNTAFTGRKFKQKPATSELRLLISDNEAGEGVKRSLPDGPGPMLTACKTAEAIGFLLPLWGCLFWGKRYRKEYGTCWTFSRSKSNVGIAAVCPERANTTVACTHLRQWFTHTSVFHLCRSNFSLQ